MTSGGVWRNLIAFSLPALIGNFLHQVYSLTDSIVVGRVLGLEALAAIGCTMPIVLLLAALMIGTNMGVGILLSQAFGSHDMERMRRYFFNSLYLGALIAAALALVGGPLSTPLLRWIGTPEGPLSDAAAYLRVNFLTSFCPLIYYLFSCAFRGMGDSRTDLYCLIISVFFNVFLDILFVAVFRWGVVGSAWATALAQMVSGIFAAILLFTKYPVMRPRRQDIQPDSAVFRRIGGLAIPIAAQSAFNNIGNIVAQSAVNSFGEVAMAAYTAGGRVGAFALMPLETVGSSFSVFTGQNFGAGNRGRIQEGLRAALWIELALSCFLGMIILCFGRELAGLFLEETSAEMSSISYDYLLITAVPGLLAGFMFVYQQILRGLGNARDPMHGGILQLAVKAALIMLGAKLRSLTVIWAAWPVSFTAAGLFMFFRYRHFRKERFL